MQNFITRRGMVLGGAALGAYGMSYRCGPRVDVAAAPSSPGPISAPTLMLNTSAADETPPFTAIPEGALPSDVIEIQIDEDPSFGSLSDSSDTVDGGELMASELSFTLAALSNGSYFARARLVRGEIASEWSDSLVFRVDGSSCFEINPPVPAAGR